MAIRKGDWKLAAYIADIDGGDPQDVTPVKLYNLKQDIGETKDLASAEPQELKELKTLWDQWSQSLAEPLWPQQSSAPSPASKPK
jgi:arylsulfatase A-like enzyme